MRHEVVYTIRRQHFKRPIEQQVIADFKEFDFHLASYTVYRLGLSGKAGETIFTLPLCFKVGQVKDAFIDWCTLKMEADTSGEKYW